LLKETYESKINTLINARLILEKEFACLNRKSIELNNDRNELRKNLVEINDKAKQDRDIYRSQINVISTNVEKVKNSCKKAELDYTNSRKENTNYCIEYKLLQD